MTVIFVILDGAADRRNESLNGATPLQSAEMPNLRQMASHSLKGMMYPIREGIAPESDAAVFSILGYDISSYTGRGPLESFGAGLKVTDRSVAFRCNFATIDKNREIIDRRAGRIGTHDAKSLEKEINRIHLGLDGVRFRFKSTVGHRGACVFYSSKEPLSANVSNADIGYIRKGNISIAVQEGSVALPRVMPLDESEEAGNTARIANIFIDKVIGVLPHAQVNRERLGKGLLQANAVLLRDCGVGLPKVDTFESRHGMKCAFVAEMPVEIGIARLLGMTPIRLRQIGDRKKRYRKIAELVRDNINDYDFIYVHIKGPDEPGHDGNAILKKKILEEIDSSFFSLIRDLKADVCVTCDHSTPCTLKAHSGDPVPVMVRYLHSDKSDSMPFDEYIGSTGSLGVIMGNRLIDYIISGEFDGR
ncbi:MAG: alkaline phosphatase family protein [Candidatus Marsarchaeota archaeon]|nr:alkaline phosphatase family protein [Candidatus Marsarchaeota archaeon]MCL5412870.1 alkaline phosphatase family protein [Candidatus Marsarchaeota archaeon]